MEIIQKINLEDPSAVEGFIGLLFDNEPADSLNLIKYQYSQLNPESASESEKYFLVLLESFWNFFQSQIIVSNNADFQTGFQQIQSAIEGFELLGLENFKELAVGIQLYFSAIVDSRTLNLKSGIEKIKLAREQFNKIDKYGQYFAQMIDIMESESFFLAGISHLAQLDYENGQIEIEKASRASKNLANKYYSHDSLEFNMFMGLGFLYSAFSRFFVQIFNLNTFYFEYFNYTDNDAIEDSSKAIDYLSKSMDLSEIAKINLKLAKIVDLLSKVIYDLGQSMDYLLKERSDDIEFDNKSLNQMVKNAHRFSVETGESGIVFIRFCKQIQNNISNVEKILGQKRILKKVNKYSIQNISEVQQLIQRGKTLQAIDDLMKNTIDFDLFNDLTLLNGRLARLKRGAALSLISDKEARDEEDKISQALLDLLSLHQR